MKKSAVKTNKQNIQKWRSPGLLASLLWGGLVFGGQAADWYVATNGAHTTGADWSAAFTNVQAALDVAASNDTIHVAGQTFWLTNQLEWITSGITLRGGYEADPNGASPGNHDPEQWPTVLERSGAYDHRILFMDGIGGGRLENVTMTGGNENHGAGVLVNSSEEVTLSGCFIQGNGWLRKITGHSRGVGIHVDSSEVTLTNCVVRNNSGYNNTTAYAGWYNVEGAGVYLTGGGSLMTIRDSRILNNCAWGNLNSATKGIGGGIYVDGGTLTLKNVLMAGNVVDTTGPGFYVAGGTISLDHCTVAHHAGEGLYRTSGTVAINDSIVWGNWTNIVGDVTVQYSNIGDPGFAGINNNLSADPWFEYGYYLNVESPCVDAGSDTAVNLEMDAYTTRTDGVGDSGVADLGYHPMAGFDLGVADLYVSPDGDDGNGGTSVSEPFRTVTKALATARAGTRIHVAAGQYNAAGGESFPLTANDLPGIQVLGTNAATTVLDAGGTGARVMELVRSHQARLAGITLTGGEVDTGAGLGVDNCQEVQLSGCRVEGNSFYVTVGAKRNGAGIHASLSGLTLTNCLVRDNVGINRINHGSAGMHGGGIWSDGVLVVRDSRILDNIAAVDGTYPAGRGGGIYFDGFRLDFKNVLLAGNSTMRTAPERGNLSAIGTGHGLYVAGGTAILRNCSVVDNTGEGIWREAGDVIVRDSIVWGNWTNIVGDVTVQYSNIGDPGFAGVNNNLSADPWFEYGYYLNVESPCVDAGSDTAANLGMDAYTTRTDGVGDSGVVDMGYHQVESFDLEYADLYVSPDGDDGNSGTSTSEPFRTVTKALAVARAGSRIHVTAGKYNMAGGETFPLGATDLPEIQFLGADRDTTILDASGSGTRVLALTRSHRARLENITLTGGEIFFGGGLAIESSQGVEFFDCTVSNNVFEASYISSRDGAGIFAASSDVRLEQCLVLNNSGRNGANHSKAYARGGGIWSDGILEILESVFGGNAASSLPNSSLRAEGGGVCISAPSPRVALKNVLVCDNSATGQGDGIHTADKSGSVILENGTVAGNEGEGLHRAGGTVTLRNSILWENGADIVGDASVFHSNVETGGYGSAPDENGNLGVDPQFVDTTYYHLRSPNGHYLDGYFSGGTWGFGGPYSPCIAIGDPASDFSREPMPNGRRINMGAYGNTPVASKFMPAGTLFMIR